MGASVSLERLGVTTLQFISNDCDPHGDCEQWLDTGMAGARLRLACVSMWPPFADEVYSVTDESCSNERFAFVW